MTKYKIFNNTKEAQQGLNVINLQINKLHFKDDDISLVYLGESIFQK